MTFQDKYTTEDKMKLDDKEKSKTILSNEGFAIAELLNDLKFALNRLVLR